MGTYYGSGISENTDGLAKIGPSEGPALAKKDSLLVGWQVGKGVDGAEDGDVMMCEGL